MTQYLTMAAMAFLVLEVLIVGLCVLIGYKRGLGRTIVRAVYLAIIGVVSLIVGRSIAATATGIAMDFLMPSLPSEILSLIEQKPELLQLVENLVGALLVPLLFTTLFVVLQLLTLICFRLISKKLVSLITKKNERSTVGKWTGAAAGLVLGIVIAAVLLAPLYTVVHIVENTPETTIAIAGESFLDEELTLDTEGAMYVSDFAFVNKMLVRGLTTYDIPDPAKDEKGTEPAIDTVPVLLATAGDALYAYGVTADQGGTMIDAIANTAAAITPHISESSAVRHITADALYLLGVAFRDDGEFMGFTLPEADNAILNSIIKNLIDTLSKTTAENVEANMVSLFGRTVIAYGTDFGDISVNQGLLASMFKLDPEDPMKSLEDEALSGAVSSAINNLSDNENMSEVLTDIKDFAVDIMNSSEIDLSDEKYDPLYEEISENLSAKLNEHIDTESNEMASVSEVAKDLESTIESYFTAYDVPMGSFETSVLASCIAQEFYKEENIVDGQFNVTVDEVLDFFGITQSDIDDFLNGDASEDFDVSDLPEDFDVSDLPEDFDISDLPEGFDPSDITG